MKYLLISILLICSFNSQASVWDHDSNKKWNAQWQEKYSHWIATSFTKTFFRDLGKPYNKLRLDCADAQYGLQAYFSMLHGLPFSVNKGKLTNKTTRFDHIKGKNNRMKALIAHLAANYSTLNLAHNDTYPIGYTEFMPGDIFMYNTGSTRHTYIIKNINVNGTFDVIYSTQAAAKEGRPFYRKKSYMFKKRPNHTRKPLRNSWGFRRMKMPHQSAISQYDLPESNFEQYDDARKLSTVAFFEKVRRLNSKINESPKDLLTRNFNDVCSSVVERKAFVNEALAALKGNLKNCMNFNNYDAYSTPSRDSGIMNDYSVYEFNLKKIQDQGLTNKLGSHVKSITYAIFGDQNQKSKFKNDLRTTCAVNVKDVHGTIDLENFRNSIFSGKVSFHPNDNKNRRWGFAIGDKTRCKTFYGYPE